MGRDVFKKQNKETNKKKSPQITTALIENIANL